MSLLQLYGSLQLGLIQSFVVLGVYLSFRTLQFSDLTIDGTFPLGAAVVSVLIINGINPIWATIMAIIMGGIFGWITSFLATSLKIFSLLSGILTMSALYSINLRIMGQKANISLLGEKTIFTMGSFNDVAILILLVVTISFLIFIFLKSELGLAVRTVGHNPLMAKAHGVNIKKAISIGLILSNASVALSGALYAQMFGFADITLGIGTIIFALASLILGEAIIPQKKIFYCIISCILGPILYRILISFALNLDQFGLHASDLNIITAILVIVAMILSQKQKQKHKGIL